MSTPLAPVTSSAETADDLFRLLEDDSSVVQVSGNYLQDFEIKDQNFSFKSLPRSQIDLQIEAQRAETSEESASRNEVTQPALVMIITHRASPHQGRLLGW